jgi:uncharacterized membrane protein
MLILLMGIVVFLGVHSLTTFRETRESLIKRFGQGPFKGLYSLIAVAGFVLIVWGFSRYRAEGLITVWTPPTWTRHLTMGLMWFAFVALACMNPAPGRIIRGWLRHPMLVAIKSGRWHIFWRMAMRVACCCSGLFSPGQSSTASPSRTAATWARARLRHSHAPMRWRSGLEHSPMWR